MLLETRSNPINQWKDMNYAVWHIFDASSPLDNGAAAWLSAAEVEAGRGSLGSTAAGWTSLRRLTSTILIHIPSRSSFISTVASRPIAVIPEDPFRLLNPERYYCWALE